MQGFCHRLVSIVVPTELFAVAGDQQQGVVRAGAEDQDGQNPGALAVDGQTCRLDEDVDDTLGASEGDDCREHGQEPENRASIGEQQDDDDDADRRQEQRAVDAFEGRRRVCCAAGRTGDVGGESRRAASILAHLIDHFGGRIPAVLAEIQGYVDLRRLTVTGRGEGHDLAVDAGDGVTELLAVEGLEPGGVGRDLGLVGLGQPALAFIDHESWKRVFGLEDSLGVQRLGGLGAVGKPAGRLVVLDTGQFGGEAAEDDDRDEPEGHDGVLGPATADE